MTETFSFRVNLRETPLTEVFASVDGPANEGVLEVTREGMVKRVHVERGYVVHASSSDPIDRLSEHIRRAGLMEAARIEALDHERSNSNERLGTLLINRGLMAPGEVYDAICGQIASIVWSLFAWDQGVAEFRPGRTSIGDMVRVKLPMRRVAFEGIKRAPRLESSALGPLADRDVDGSEILHADYRVEDLIEIGIDATEMELLGLVDGRRTMGEILAASPLAPNETLRRLRAFAVLSLLRPEEGGRQAPVDPADLARSAGVS